jgi:hypothetical protein
VNPVVIYGGGLGAPNLRGIGVTVQVNRNPLDLPGIIFNPPRRGMSVFRFKTSVDSLIHGGLTGGAPGWGVPPVKVPPPEPLGSWKWGYGPGADKP